MLPAALTGLDRKRLRLGLLLLFLALAIPTGVLIQQAYSQLKWEAFHQHQLLAEELAARIDGRLIELIDTEEARSFTDYTFLVIAGDPAASFLQRSPLSAYPVAAAIPGLIGYFQVDAKGTFSTPLLPQPGVEPTAYGISGNDLEQRLMLGNRIQRILSRNQLVEGGRITVGPGGRAEADLRQSPSHGSRQRPSVQPGAQSAAPVKAETIAESLLFEDAAAPTEEASAAGQAAFDRLDIAPGERQQERKQKAVSKLGRVEDLQLDFGYRGPPGNEPRRQIMPQQARLRSERDTRKERSALPEPETLFRDQEPSNVAPPQAPREPQLRIRIFESEIDPFEISLLDSGHFVLFRKVWRDGQRYIQGALIDQQRFLQGVVEALLRETALSRMSDLVVAYRGDVLSVFSAQMARDYLPSARALRGALLYRTRLSTPLSELELIFSITRLPAGPGATVITWVAAILTVVLCGGFYLMYRLGLGQINLARQQQDFVSAVSHELKTPLTSIRMYGEILREGWAPDDKKKTYYDYIYHESERLSRLINNVLQLARMTRNDLKLDLKPLTVAELMDGIRSKVTSPIERADFELHMASKTEATEAVVRIDPDCFTQIIINLVDNAIKFAVKAERRTIDIAAVACDDIVSFTVRDYGPGVPGDKMKQIFKLFYRPENKLTRETVGTGIGLALVHQLTLTMGGQVDVVNRDPGAEFRLSFPALRSASPLLTGA